MLLRLRRPAECSTTRRQARRTAPPCPGSARRSLADLGDGRLMVLRVGIQDLEISRETGARSWPAPGAAPCCAAASASSCASSAWASCSRARRVVRHLFEGAEHGLTIQRHGLSIACRSPPCAGTTACRPRTAAPWHPRRRSMPCHWRETGAGSSWPQRRRLPLSVTLGSSAAVATPILALAACGVGLRRQNIRALAHELGRQADGQITRQRQIAQADFGRRHSAGT